jgi:hypothetical protein
VPCGAQPKSWALHGGGGEVGEAGNEGVAQVLEVGLPAYLQGRSHRVSSQFDRQPLFWARLDCPDARSDHEPRTVVESPVEHGAPLVVRVWVPHQESHPT